MQTREYKCNQCMADVVESDFGIVRVCEHHPEDCYRDHMIEQRDKHKCIMCEERESQQQ